MSAVLLQSAIDHCSRTPRTDNRTWLQELALSTFYSCNIEAAFSHQQMAATLHVSILQFLVDQLLLLITSVCFS